MNSGHKVHHDDQFYVGMLHCADNKNNDDSFTVTQMNMD